MGLIDRAISLLSFRSKATAIGPSLAVLLQGVSPLTRWWNSTSSISFEEAVSNGYKGLIWLHRCIAAVGNAVGSVPWKVYRIESDGTETHVPNHELEVLMRRPNKHMTGYEFMYAYIAYMYLAGESFWELVDVRRRPKAMYLLRPDWIKPIPDETLFLKGYKIDEEKVFKKVNTKWDVDEMLWFKFFDPINPYEGLSPLTAARRAMESEEGAITWNNALLKNSAVPGGVLKVPATNMQEDQVKSLQSKLELAFTGSNAHRPMVLWGGIEWEKVGLSQQDLEFAKQRQMNKYEFCAICGVPPQIVGANEDPTYANYDTARTAWWEDHIIPLLDFTMYQLNQNLAVRFGSNIVLRYDVSDVPAFRKSFKEKVETAKTMVSIGWPINAVNRRLSMGMPIVPWGDVAWMPINFMPVDAPEIPEAILNQRKPPSQAPGEEDDNTSTRVEGTDPDTEKE